MRAIGDYDSSMRWVGVVECRAFLECSHFLFLDNFYTNGIYTSKESSMKAEIGVDSFDVASVCCHFVCCVPTNTTFKYLRANVCIV